MTKKELALALAKRENLDLTQAKAADIVDALLEDIRSALTDGEEVTLRGFGSFKVTVTAARSGRNLHTQERVIIPSKKRVKFKSYIQLDGNEE